jgi:hypothetical protein
MFSVSNPEPKINKDYTIKDNILEFNCKFNKSIDNFIIPDDIISVIFGSFFNRSIDNVIFPDSCRKIEFGNDFNKSIDNVVLPKFLESIIFGHWFDQSVQKVIFPDSLRSIIFLNEFFNMDIRNTKFIKSINQLVTYGYHNSIPQIILDNDNIISYFTIKHPEEGATVNNIILLKQRMKCIELKNIELSNKLISLISDIDELKKRQCICATNFDAMVDPCGNPI